MIGYVYITTNLTNNKKYIGLKTSEKFVPTYLGSGRIIKKAINKYGKDNFSVEILEECESIEDLRDAERKWIKFYNAQSNNDFYNIAEGGQWGNCIDGMNEKELQEYKQHLSESIKKSYQTNPKLKELRAKQRKDMKGKIIVSDETKEKRSKILKQKWDDDYEGMCETVKKTIRLNKEKGTYKKTWQEHQHPWIGRKHSEDSKKKISEHTDNHGVKNPNCKSGKILRDEVSVYQFDITQDMHTYLEEQGFTRRERYRIIHGETIRGYRLQREGQTTIENTSENLEVSRVGWI